ncbi:MAG TPA: EAL domain-containing protein [Xanthobacteraceae bacterium]|nr:EAL domain-containing protein [Xanthobacteraceae bacterium]
MNKIVIVDDQPINRSIYARIAASVDAHVEVRTFAEPREALVAMLADPPDLIISDYKMPGMNGATFIRHIRAEASLADVPVIVITVFEEKSFRFRALDAGATDFLLSPVDHREFVTRARNLLRLRQQQLLLADRANVLEQRLQHSEASLQQAVRDSSERLAQVIDAVPALISATDREGRLLFANDYHGQITGYDAALHIGEDIESLLGAETGARSKALDRLVIQNQKAIHSFEEELTDRTGAKRFFQTTKSPLKNAENEIVGVVTSSLDISERKSAEKHLRFLAHHDALTGLPNRTYLTERMSQEIARARRGDRRFALHIIDLDNFKSVNDLMGHSCGDAFLVAVAKRLNTLKRAGYVVARLGGDEFAILQTGLRDSASAAVCAEEIAGVLKAVFDVDGRPTVTSASVGIAIHPADGEDIEDLVRHADLAMYKAKSEGGNQHRFFAADMHVRAGLAAALDSDLRRAMERGEFELFYQPQIRLSDSAVVGAEALIRWRREDGTLVSPAGFLPRAEENGMIVAINEWVLRTAAGQAAAWKRAGLSVERISINLSPVQFQRQSLPLLVTQILTETGLDPRCLDLELTETILMQDIEQVAAQLHHLRGLGVQISIDDFGTGFSSLSYVKRLPVDRIKIDQSFVRDLVSDPSDRAIVSAVVNLAHSLDLVVVAEGVETAEQLEIVRAIGCEEVQGYYFGRPMPTRDFERFIQPQGRTANAV